MTKILINILIIIIVGFCVSVIVAYTSSPPTGLFYVSCIIISFVACYFIWGILSYPYKGQVNHARKKQEKKEILTKEIKKD